ncbi:MAG: putative exodeoxyribonuclease 8 [Prokaryotic dsDNA virus sp.]|nr:MAG: putative exodeoxyribonuclease 8 [Prokaryotic dsDNA virus sp.]|tara:strand:+ start:14260 stop:15027 length:768 start_codon:yes stop_codon:yes gene_type:complete
MITLLNGEHWGKEEILTQMYDDEFYYNFLGKNALSSSSLKTLLKSPKTYRNILNYGDPNSDSLALAAGKLVHWMILESHKIDKLHFVDATTKNTKVYKEAKAKYGEVFLTKEKNAAERLTDAVLRNEAALKLLNNSEFEVPAIDMIEGLAFRGKADIIQGDTIIDLKTTQDLNSFKYSCDKYSYELQAWLYLKLFDKKKFTFLVIDKASTDIGIFETTEEFLARGENKFKQAVDNYKYFFEQDNDLDQYVMRGIL